jgi:hypothetical protein
VLLSRHSRQWVRETATKKFLVVAPPGPRTRLSQCAVRESAASFDLPQRRGGRVVANPTLYETFRLFLPRGFTREAPPCKRVSPNQSCGAACLKKPMATKTEVIGSPQTTLVPVYHAHASSLAYRVPQVPKTNELEPATGGSPMTAPTTGLPLLATSCLMRWLSGEAAKLLPF